MNRNEAIQRIEKLKQEIDHNNYLYHVLDQPCLSDGVFDSLKNELVKLEAEFPELITLDSPTQRVSGQALEVFEKVVHAVPMLSLADSFSEVEVLAWQERLFKFLSPEEQKNISYYAELKMDGLAMSLIYQNGLFIEGSTRGDGQVGENVTQNLKTIQAIPLKLRQPSELELLNLGLNAEQVIKLNNFLLSGQLEVRGEAIMTNSVFNKLNEKYKKLGKPLLANPRNAAAGSIRQLDARVVAERQLDFYVYSLVIDLDLINHEQEHELAKLLGFKVLAENMFCKNISEVISFHHEREQKRNKMPFECDGVVIAVNNLDYWKKIGFVGKGPRYMMAYKFANQQATTKIKEVVWQVGRTGVLTPTAILEPVTLVGVTISRCTLHNYDEVMRLNIKIGDTIILERAGDVIPKIVGVFKDLRTGQEQEIQLPSICPICQQTVNRLDDEVAVRCLNKDCYAIKLRSLCHWSSKEALDIEGLGVKIVEQLFEVGLVKDPADFYKLSESDLLPLEGFAKKSAQNLIKAINDKKEIFLERFFYALSIRHIGVETAETLSKYIISKYQEKYQNQIIELSLLLNVFKDLSLEELQELEDVGPIVGQSIYDWFMDVNNGLFLEKLLSVNIKIKIRQIDHQNINELVNNKIFVLTGSLVGLTRDEARLKIKQVGGSVAGSVSKKTDYVVVGAEAGSKYDEAIKLGIKTLNEVEFLNLFK